MDWNQYAKDIKQADANVQRLVSGGKITLDKLGFTNTLHQSGERQGRDASIKQSGGPGNEVLAVYYVDKGHYNGPELHWITDNGIIIITNALRGNGLDICTKLIARPQQLRRYTQGGNRDWYACEQMFPNNDWKVPSWLLNTAEQHQNMGLNYTESIGNEDDLAKKIVDIFLHYYDLDENGNPTQPKDEDFGSIDSISCETLDKIWDLVKRHAPA